MGVRPRSYSKFQILPMFWSYLKISLRSLWRTRFFTTVNVLGLAAGLSICMLIITLIRDQSDYDRFHEQKDRIYRVISHRTSSSSSSFATAPMVLAETLKEYPGVANTVRIRARLGADVRYEETTIPLEGIWSEPSFFDVFSFDLAQGDAATALAEPYTVVLSRDAIQKLGMAPAEAVGQVVTLGDYGDFRVTGLLEEPPGKTHLAFEVLASLASLRPLQEQELIYAGLDRWSDTDHGFVYLLSEQPVAADHFATAFQALSDREYARMNNYRLDFKLQPLRAITPSRFLENDLLFTVPKVALYFLSFLALVVILTACFNYTNLSVANMLTRSKEVGVRKVTGASRSQLFLQFIGQAVIMAFVSLILAWVLLEIMIIPAFRSLFFTQFFDIDLTVDAPLWGAFLILTLLVGGLAGFLPAFYLSGMQPAQALRSVTGVKLFSKLGWRKVLIGLQFAVSLIFVTTVVILFQQTRFMLQADYGFNKENVINLALQGQDYREVREELLRDARVKAVSGCSVIPASGTNQGNGLRTHEETELSVTHQILVDEHFLSNLDLALVAGRPFTADNAPDQVLINETAARRLGWTEPAAAVGHTFILGPNAGEERTVEVRGVVKNFHYLELERQIGNLVLQYHPEAVRWANIRVSGDNLSATLSFIEDIWQRFDAVHPVDYVFFDDQVARIISVYRDLMKILGFLAMIAILITALGILGIATYSVQTRTKEIGIRKVLGAELPRIVWTVSRGLFLPVAIAIVLALPVAWLLNRLWLQDMAYHIALTIWNMGVGAIGLLLLCALVVGGQALRVAARNPVAALRAE